MGVIVDLEDAMRIPENPSLDIMMKKLKITKTLYLMRIIWSVGQAYDVFIYLKNLGHQINTLKELMLVMAKIRNTRLG